MRRLARFIERHPRRIVIVFTLAATAFLALHLTRARFDLSFQTAVSGEIPELAAFERLVDEFGDFERLFLIVASSEDVLSRESLTMTAAITGRLLELEDTSEIVSLTNARDIQGDGKRLIVAPLVSEYPADLAEREELRRRLVAHPLAGGTLISADGRTSAMVGRMVASATDPYGQYLYFNEIRRILDEEAWPGAEFHIVGNPSTYATLMGHMLRDATVLLPLTALTMGVLLWLTFGRLAVVWQALAPIAIAVAVTYGVLSVFDLPITVLTGHGVLAVLIIIIGLSDAIHLLSRLDEGDDGASSLEKSLAPVARACFLTSLTTGIGFLSLVFSGVPMVRDFGTYGALGMLCAFVATVVFVPAASLLGRLSPEGEASGRRAVWPDRVTDLAHRLVVAGPRAVFVLGVAAFIVSAFLIPGVAVDSRPLADLKRDDPTVAGVRFVEENLGGAFPLEVLFNGSAEGAIKNPKVLGAMDTVARGLEELDGISRVVSPVAYIKQMNRAMHGGDEAAFDVPASREAVSQYLLLFEMAGSDSEFERLVNYDYSTARLRALMDDLPTAEFNRILAELDGLATAASGTGVSVTAAGEAPLFHAMSGRAISALVRSLYVAMPVIFVVTGLAFRSWRVGLLTVLPNLLPLTVGLGFLALADISLRFSTVVAFPVAFGIAVDDTIHFLSRYREEVSAGASRPAAIRTAMASAGRAMLLTTVFLVVGFSVLFFSEFLAVVHIAAVVSVVLVSALVADLLLLPALLLMYDPAISASHPREG